MYEQVCLAPLHLAFVLLLAAPLLLMRTLFSLLLVVFRFCRRWHPEAGLVSRNLEQRPAWLAKPIARHESNAGLSQINERQSLKSQRVTGLRKAGFDKPTWMITQADGACSPKHRHEQARVSACA